MVNKSIGYQFLWSHRLHCKFINVQVNADPIHYIAIDFKVQIISWNIHTLQTWHRNLASYKCDLIDVQYTFCHIFGVQGSGAAIPAPLMQHLQPDRISHLAQSNLSRPNDPVHFQSRYMRRHSQRMRSKVASRAGLAEPTLYSGWFWAAAEDQWCHSDPKNVLCGIWNTSNSS